MAPQIIFKNVSYDYSPASVALSHVSFRINPGSFTMVVGRTGSGKSTLVQQINGLLKPTRGLIKVGDLSVTDKANGEQLKKLRQVAGLVFQIPRDQLFGETVKEDLAFGPRNFGFNKDQINASIKESARLLKITPLLSKSPFDLSGGQMKRVAIAGVLACHPKIVILDEPTVGLDHYGENYMMTIINNLRKQFHLTVVMVTHQMNLVAKYADQVLVLNHGKLIANVKPAQLFDDRPLLKRAGLVQPFVPRIATWLSRQDVKFAKLPLTITNLANDIANVYKVRRRHE